MSIAAVLVELALALLLPEFAKLGFVVVVWHIHHLEHQLRRQRLFSEKK
jgi:hypothetical protein